MSAIDEDACEAPGRLALVEAFINSVEMPEGEDKLATPESARTWLHAHGILTDRLDEPTRRRLVELREAMRDLLEGNERDEIPAEAAELIMQRLNASRLAVVISSHGTHTHPAAGATGIEAFHAELAAAMITASIDGTWARLKVCHNEACRWAFFDHSKNARRTWCSMASCGCQAKSRAYRARKRESSLSAGD